MGEVHNEWSSGTVKPPKPVVPGLGSAPAPPPERRTSGPAPQPAPKPAPAAPAGPNMTVWLALALGLVLLVLFVLVLAGRDDTGSKTACNWERGEPAARVTFIGQSGEINFYFDGQTFFATKPSPKGGSEFCAIALTPVTTVPAQPGASP